MVGTKGMKPITTHRAFTYQEKKFNRLGRSGLIEYFKPKLSAEKIQDYWALEHQHNITLTLAKRVARVAGEKAWEGEDWKELRGFTEAMVDSIIHLGKVYDITNIEAFAMTLHLYDAMRDRKNLTQEELGNISERTLQMVNSLRQENWDAFMRILKEIS